MGGNVWIDISQALKRDPLPQIREQEGSAHPRRETMTYADIAYTADTTGQDWAISSNSSLSLLMNQEQEVSTPFDVEESGAPTHSTHSRSHGQP